MTAASNDASRRSLNAQTYCDARSIASIASFLIGDEALDRRTISDLLRRCVETTHELFRNMKEKPEGYREFATTDDAIRYLQANGFSTKQLIQAPAVSRATVRALEAEDRLLESAAGSSEIERIIKELEGGERQPI